MKYLNTNFRLYDIVSRRGTDEQIITEIDTHDLGMTVVCIKGDDLFHIGEEESNLHRRYDFVRHGFGSDVPKIEDAEFITI